MHWKSPVAALSLMASVLALVSTPIAPAQSMVLDIKGNAIVSPGTTPESFEIYLSGNDNKNCDKCYYLQLDTATIKLGTGSPASFTDKLYIGLNFGPDYAYFGKTNASNPATDILEFTFANPADFASLQNTAPGPFGPFNVTVTDNNFNNIGDPLTLGSFTDVTISGIATGGVPELSTWAMMLIGFAGVGFVAYRRTKKRSAALAAA
jgi:hypothetical protein